MNNINNRAKSTKRAKNKKDSAESKNINTLDSNAENVTQETKPNIKPDNIADLRTQKRKTGDIGEDVAIRFLMKHGYSICDRNFLKKYGELDIVALKGGIYHFIEVKTVTQKQDVIRETLEYPDNKPNDGYKAEDNVHTWKLKRLARVIQAYILEKLLFEHEWVFDLITVKLNMVSRIAQVRTIRDIVL